MTQLRSNKRSASSGNLKANKQNKKDSFDIGFELPKLDSKNSKNDLVERVALLEKQLKNSNELTESIIAELNDVSEQNSVLESRIGILENWIKCLSDIDC